MSLGGEPPPKRAKQDPAEKSTTGAVKEKVFFSYADVHDCMSRLVPRLRAEFDPTVIVAIGGGGFIPARMLRSELKVPILAVSLELYDDATKAPQPDGQVKIKQWFDPESELARSTVHGGRVLIVDEVDDTRATLQFCAEELLGLTKQANGSKERLVPKEVAVAVVHNKLKEKAGVLPEGVRYFAGDDVEPKWNCYPWDAAAYGHSIWDHEELARKQKGS